MDFYIGNHYNVMLCYGALLDHKQVCKTGVFWDVTPCSVIDR